MTDRTRLVFVCTPNNPTSTIVTESELTEFLDGAFPRHAGTHRVTDVTDRVRKATATVAAADVGLTRAAEIAAMMEPFARGEASRNRETGGAGLGLTLARAIAEQHGGTITLKNRAGEDAKTAGLVAELRLPLD